MLLTSDDFFIVVRPLFIFNIENSTWALSLHEKNV